MHDHRLRYVGQRPDRRHDQRGALSLALGCRNSSSGATTSTRSLAKIYTACAFTEEELTHTVAFLKSRPDRGSPASAGGTAAKGPRSMGPAVAETGSRDQGGVGEAGPRAVGMPCPRSERTAGGGDGGLRLRSLRHRRRLGRRARRPHRGAARRPGGDRRGIPHGRHLRHPRLHAQEAAGLCQPLPRRVRGRRRLRLDRRRRRASTGRP